MKQYKWLSLFLLSLILITGSQPHLTQAATTIIYVNGAATGANNGSSWANAFTDLQAALAAASPGAGDKIEIWVAKGTYKPSASGNREATFTLKNRVALYGGFTGTETQRTQRNHRANVTILSGDLQGNDGSFAVGDPSLDDNSKIVVTASNVNNTAILDGFQVSGGYNIVVSTNTVGNGAGIYLSSAGALLSNLTITRNMTGSGAGVYVTDFLSQASPVVANVRFINNYALFWGGAIRTTAGSSLTVYNSIFNNNQAEFQGGAISNYSGTLTVVNSSSSGNVALDKGGFLYTEDETVTLSNVIIWNDTAYAGNSVIFNDATTPSTITVSNSLIQGGFAGGTNIINQDPLFADTANSDLSLLEGSPAIDAGNNSQVPADTTDLDQDGNTAETLPLDLAGRPRRNNHPQTDTGSGTAPLVDIGAYETTTPVFVTVSGQVTNDNGAPLAGVVVSPITIGGLEISQVIQNLNNTLPLIQGKETVAKVYPESGGPSLPITVLLSGTHGGAALPGSPLSIVASAPPTLDRGSYSNNANFSLPASWLAGQVTFSASLDSSNDAVGVTDANGMYSIKLKAGTYTITPQSDTASFAGKSVTLTNQNQTLNFTADAAPSPDPYSVYLPIVIKPAGGGGGTPPSTSNKTSFTVTFTDMPDLDLKIVPINYTHTANGTTYPAPTAGEVAGIKDYLKFRYPVKAVNVTVAPAINMTGNAQTGKALRDMLDQLAQIKMNDGAPNAQVYYGISKIPGEVAGSAGVAYLGVRVGTGIHTGGFLAAHEIGHTFSLQHPCEDENSPYQTNSRIGEYGLNLSVTPPQVYSPDNTTSIMLPGCPHPGGVNSWFSDYEYKIMYNAQLSYSPPLLSQAISDILAIRATFDGENGPHLKPVYGFTATPTAAPEGSAYTVELLNAEGQVIATYPVQLAETEEMYNQPALIFARVPTPSEPVVAVRLLHNGNVVDTRAVASTAVEPTISEGADSLTVRWGNTTAPALVRYTTDGGATWNTIGLDVLGGELVVERDILPAGQVQFQVVLGN